MQTLALENLSVLNENMILRGDAMLRALIVAEGQHGGSGVSTVALQGEGTRFELRSACLTSRGS